MLLHLTSGRDTASKGGSGEERGRIKGFITPHHAHVSMPLGNLPDSRERRAQRELPPILAVPQGAQ